MTLRPEWGGTARVLLGFASVMGGIAVTTFVKRWVDDGWPDAKVAIVTALVLAFLAFVASVGVRSARRRVDLDVQGGTLTLTWALPRRVLDVRSVDVEDVVLERDARGAARIVIRTVGQPVPLMETFSSDDLEHKARELRAFLGLA